MITADTSLEMKRIITVGKHGIAVIAFQENSMTLRKAVHNFPAGMTDIGDDADIHLSIGDHKAMRIGSIVVFSEAVTWRLPMLMLLPAEKEYNNPCGTLMRLARIVASVI